MSATKVAIIEDDPAIVQMYKNKFVKSGYDVSTASNGAEGIELVKSFGPEIVLLDLMMPGVDGFGVLEELRRHPGGKALKIVVLTNMGDSETATRVLEHGADDYIIKAELTPTQVEQRLEKLLGKQQPRNR